MEISFLRRTQQFRCSVRHTMQTEMQKIAAAKALQASLDWSKVQEKGVSKGPACFFHLLPKSCFKEKSMTRYQHSTGERRGVFCVAQFFWRVQNTNQEAFSVL